MFPDNSPIDEKAIAAYAEKHVKKTREQDRELLEAFKAGMRTWEEYYARLRDNWPYPGKEAIIVIAGESFEGMDFSDYRVEAVKFENVTFIGCEFARAVFSGCRLENCTFSDCRLVRSKFTETTFTGISAGTTSFTGAVFQNLTEFSGYFNNCDFRKASFSSSFLTNATFSKCDIRGTDFGTSNLEHTKWEKVCVDRDSNLRSAFFGCQSVTRDRSETTLFPTLLHRYFFNWAVIRSLGNIPVFGFSWGVFLVALFLVNMLGALNQLDPPLFPEMKDIPIPHDIGLILASSLPLAFGSTFYFLFCPEQVKEFSVSQWVYEHKYFRIEHIVASLQRPFLMSLSVLSLSVGASMGLYLVVSRVINAFRYFL